MHVVSRDDSKKLNIALLSYFCDQVTSKVYRVWTQCWQCHSCSVL